MKISELLDFLKNRMKPSHIYQPVLIRTLVDAGGTATIRQLAQALLVQDESQILYYAGRLRGNADPGAESAWNCRKKWGSDST